MRLVITYRASTGRNWKHGEDVVIVPSVAVRPYLRITPQPDLQ